MNKARLKAAIASAIKKLPTNIVLYRYGTIDDGMGGYMLKEMPDVVEGSTSFDVLIDNSKGTLKLPIAEAGIVKRISNISLIAEFSDAFQIKEGDFFLLDDNVSPASGLGALDDGNVKKYTIVQATNLLNLGVCWVCELEVS